MAIMVYKYAIDRRWVPPTELLEQMQLGAALKNFFTEVDRCFDEAYNSLLSDQDEVSAIENRLQDAQSRLETLLKAASRERQERKKRSVSKETAQKIKELRGEISAIRLERKSARARQRENLKPEIENLRAQRKKALKAADAAFKQNGIGFGLYWGTAGAVRDSHDAAVKRVIKNRKEGKPSELKFRRFDGTGRIAGQIMHQQGDPMRTPKLLSEPENSENKWKGIFKLPKVATISEEEWKNKPRSERRRLAKTKITITLGGGRQQRLIEIPVNIHRPLPDDVDVAFWQISRVRVGREYRMALCITVRRPDPSPICDRPPTAIHFGWRTQPDDSIKVATIATKANIDVPQHIHDRYDDDTRQIISSDGQFLEVYMPGSWVRELDRLRNVAGVRTKNFNIALKDFVEYLRSNEKIWKTEKAEKKEPKTEYHPAKKLEMIAEGIIKPRDPQPAFRRWTAEVDENVPVQLPAAWLSPARVATWRSPERLSKLVAKIIKNPDGWDPEIVSRMKSWYLQNLHLYDWIMQGEDQLRARRTDAWRNIAALLMKSSGTIVLDSVNFAELRRKEDIAETQETIPGEQADKTRSRAAFAAPGVLRDAIVIAAKSAGVEVVEGDQTDITCVHKECGHKNTGVDFAKSTIVMCECGHPYNQDRNAAEHLLAQAY